MIVSYGGCAVIQNSQRFAEPLSRRSDKEPARIGHRDTLAMTLSLRWLCECRSSASCTICNNINLMRVSNRFHLGIGSRLPLTPNPEYIQEAARAIIEGGLDDGQDLPEGWEGRDLTGVDPDGRPGDIPMTLGGLCKLKGVGPKMAFLALQCAWNINAGVGVDVHVHRITKYGIYALIYLVHTTDSLVFIL